MVRDQIKPLDLLEETIGEEVMIHLKDGAIYEGLLLGYDQHMNLVIDGENIVIIRGDNIETVIIKDD